MYKTDHKLELINIFENNKDKTYSAVALVEELKEKMNKTTIYRQLKSLEKNSTIRRVYNPNTETYEYQYSNGCNSHLHLKCKSCGNVIHLSCSEANSFMEHIYENHGFRIDNLSTTIFGICKECMIDGRNS